MKMGIIAVVVTYNRLMLLKRCIESLRGQSLSVDCIIVINNSSTDGTAEWLAGQSDLIVITQPNVGGSGGFKRGMAEAIALGAQWIWVMDDDGYADLFCLERLMAISCSGIEYLAPNLISGDGVSHFRPLLAGTSRNVIWHSGGPFNGILMSRNLISEVGGPMQDFFIWGDEYEFLNRVLSRGYLTVLVRNAIFYHKSTVVDYSRPSRYFYMVRNLFWRAKLINGNWLVGRRAGRILILHQVFYVFLSLSVNFNIKGIGQAVAGSFAGILDRPKK